MKFPRPTIAVNDCIAIWKRAIGHRKVEGPCLKGRKQIMFDGEPWKPSRLAFHLNVRPIPRTPGSMKYGLVLHTCDNEWCINPEHLYWGTAAQNLNDMYERHPTIFQTKSIVHTGLKHTEATKKKMSKAQTGRVISEDARIKMAIKQKLTQARRSPEERQAIARHASQARWSKK